MRRLTSKEHLFVSYYLGRANCNATEAARLAGYDRPGDRGHRLQKKASIRARIDAHLNEVAITADEVLAELSSIATLDLSDFVKFKPDGSIILDLRTAKQRGKTGLIKKLTPTKYGLAIELHDKQAALEKLGRYHGLFGKEDNRSASVERDNISRELDDPTGA